MTTRRNTNETTTPIEEVTVAAREVTCPSCGTRNRTPVIAKGRPRCGKCHTNLPWLVEVTTADFDAMVQQSVMPVLLDV
jgi:thioredoxin 2